MQKSKKELLFYAVVFEAIAILLVTPLASWLADKPLTEIGVWAIMGACIACIWNMVFNAFFEKLEVKYSWKKTFSVRLARASAFELGLFSIVVPLTAVWLGIDVGTAFMLNIGMVLFFLPYAFIFDVAYDKARSVLKNRFTPKLVTSY